MAARVLKGLLHPLLKSSLKCSSFFSSVHSNGTNHFPSAIATLIYRGSSRSYDPCTHFMNLAPAVMRIHSLTDTRLPKRRPSDTPRRKRASLKPPGPYAWVPYVPGEPIGINRPNKGSVKHRNHRKRMKQRQDFILSEAKKRKAQVKAANERRNAERIERKMAAVARGRAWAERLADLQKHEVEAKESTM